MKGKLTHLRITSNLLSSSQYKKSLNYWYEHVTSLPKKSLIDFDRNFIKHNLGRFDIFVEFSDPNGSPFIAPLILIFDFFYRYFVVSAY